MFRKRPVPDRTARCSFCHKAEDAARELIPSPSNDFWKGVYICSECVAVCNDILADGRSDKEIRGPVEDAGGDSDTPPIVRLNRDKTTTIGSPFGLSDVLEVLAATEPSASIILSFRKALYPSNPPCPRQAISHPEMRYRASIGGRTRSTTLGLAER